VIVAVNGDKIETPRDLVCRIATLGPGKTADVTYLRSAPKDREAQTRDTATRRKRAPRRALR
jgi:S1-C subfamily serine protease